MKILAIDTSTKNLCLAIYDQGKFYEYNLAVGRELSVLLAPSIQRAVEGAGLKISDIDYFAAGLGPGSFTGLRIGLAAIKGISVIGNKPVIGVSSLDILAKNAGITDRVIVSALDARRGLIYCSSYKNEKGILKRKSNYQLLSQDEFIKTFPSKSVILGDALDLYRNKILSHIKGSVALDKDYWKLSAHNLMELVLNKIKSRQASSALTIKPIYLYPKECQIKTR